MSTLTQETLRDVLRSGSVTKSGPVGVVRSFERILILLRRQLLRSSFRHRSEGLETQDTERPESCRVRRPFLRDEGRSVDGPVAGQGSLPLMVERLEGDVLCLWTNGPGVEQSHSSRSTRDLSVDPMVPLS